MKMFFSHSVRIAFHHADPAGVVFFGKLFEIAHGVYEEAAASHKSGKGFSNWFQNKKFAFPIRNAEADYLAPIRAGEVLTARVYVEGVSESSWVLRCDFTQGRKVLAMVKTVHVCVAKATGAKAPLPASIRKFLK